MKDDLENKIKEEQIKLCKHLVISEEYIKMCTKAIIDKKYTCKYVKQKMYCGKYK